MDRKVCTEKGSRREHAEHYMRLRVEEHIDSCGEVNMTALAEETADAGDLYEDDIEYGIPEWVFELAYDIAQEFEKSANNLTTS